MSLKMPAKVEMIAVVAMAKNRVIGDGDGLIWHLPDDLKRVKALTMGCPLIMGRKTWDSIGRALPGRASIVMTRNQDWTAEGAVPVVDMDAAIAASKQWIANTAKAREAIILFGGGQIYDSGLPFCNRVELTIVDCEPDGGVNAALFPQLDEAQWTRHVESETAPHGDVPGFRYETLTRTSPVLV